MCPSNDTHNFAGRVTSLLLFSYCICAQECIGTVSNVTPDPGEDLLQFNNTAGQMVISVIYQLLSYVQAAEAGQKMERTRVEELAAKLAQAEAALHSESAKTASPDLTKQMQLLEQSLKVSTPSLFLVQ